MTAGSVSFAPDIVDVGNGVHLIGAECAVCGRQSFPAQSDCPWCGGATTRSALPDVGSVVTFTVVHLPLPFLGAPTVIALVALGADVQVQGAVRDASGGAPVLAIGDRCRVAGLEVVTADGPRVAYCFEPVDA
jgi:uncharacterized OB-fold protein